LFQLAGKDVAAAFLSSPYSDYGGHHLAGMAVFDPIGYLKHENFTQLSSNGRATSERRI
jgi:hypothetical protein